MSKANHELLAAAAKDALRAPSVLNTQPWAWSLEGEALELRADRSRQLKVIDPDGKLLLLSCGIALHHAQLSLARHGHVAKVRHITASLTDDVLARVTVGEPREPDTDERAMYDATWRRRTDRRPFGERPVSAEVVAELESVARAAGASLHRVRYDQMPMLAIATAEAAAAEEADPAYRVELMRWTNRPEWSGDGVPPETAVAQVPRRVPIRSFTFSPNEGMPVTPGGDAGSAYLIIYGEGDEGPDWLAAGEAVSAVMLRATTLGLAIAPMSDVIEVAHPRDLVAGLLPHRGHPYLVLRCGWAAETDELGRVPRRAAGETITGLADE